MKLWAVILVLGFASVLNLQPVDACTKDDCLSLTYTNSFGKIVSSILFFKVNLLQGKVAHDSDSVFVSIL